MEIRKALPRDAGAISVLLGGYARKGMLLPRAEEEILENIRDFFVCETEGELLGCCALKVYDPSLGEIRSLAVAESGKGQGCGRVLVEACEKDAAGFRLEQVFALTYIPDFFARLGYREVQKETLPQKIWRDCFKCINFPNCSETAVLKNIPAAVE